MNHNNQLREVLMKKYDINSILHIFHDGKGHVGMEKTYAAIAELYYWKVLKITLNHATNVRDWIL